MNRRQTAEQRRTSMGAAGFGLSCLQDTLNKLQRDEQRHEQLMADLATRLAVRQGLAKRAAAEHKQMNFSDSGYVFMRTLGRGRHGLIKVAKRKTTAHVKHTKATTAQDDGKEPVSQFVAVRIIQRVVTGTSGVRAADLLATKESHASLMRQIQALRDLDHPNIQREIETFEDAMQLYIVMELYTGGELLSRERQALSEARTAWCMSQICSAMAHAHDKGIVHQDLRPENVLYATPAEDSRIVVTDWSCADYISTPVQASRNHLFLNEYSAPELEPKKRTDRGDMWSIGVMTYALLTLSLPFGAHSPRARPVDFEWHESDPQVSTGCREFIQSLLRVDPTSRMPAKVALQHPWLRQAREGADGVQRRMTVSASVASSLLRFKESSALQRTAAALAADHLSGEKLAELTEQFNLLDKDGDGRVEKADMIEALQNMLDEEKGRENRNDALEELTEEIEELLGDKSKVTALVNLMDTDGDGKISYSDFLAAAGEACLSECTALCWEAFRAFDRDGNGSITKKELDSLLSAPILDEVLDKAKGTGMGIKRTKTRQDLESALSELGGGDSVEEMFRRVDSNNDQRINFEEFMQMLLS